MKKLVVVLLAHLMVLALVAPASADWTPGTVTGTVLSSSGRPALGARVFVSDQWSYVQADGSFNITIQSGTYSIFVFQGTIGLDEADYPYQELHPSGQITVNHNQTTRVNLTLPLKSNAPPELAAVAGTVATTDGAIQWRHRVYLVDQNGTHYSAFTDDEGRYIVAAPEGTYRLFAQSNSSSSTYLGRFYGDHPRGYALAWDEAEVFVLDGPGETVTDRDVTLAAGHYVAVESEGTSIGVPSGADDLEYGVYAAITADLQDLARIGRPEPEPKAVLEDYSIFAYPGIKDPNPGVVTLYIRDSVFNPLLFEELQVWLDFEPVPDCDGEVTVPCVQARTVDSAWDGDTIELEVAIEKGGVFALGDRPQFYDARDSVFGGDIRWLADSGITKGCRDAGDVFCPDDPVTRGQMAAFLVRGLGLTDSLDDPFSDDDDSIFESSIERLAAAGITRGCNPPANDRFCPDDPVTRGQMAAFLVRALGYTDAGDGDLFTDDDGSIFEDAIDKLATGGVTRGCNPPVNDSFCPNDVVTRAQMAAFLHRALG